MSNFSCGSNEQANASASRPSPSPPRLRRLPRQWEGQPRPHCRHCLMSSVRTQLFATSKTQLNESFFPHSLPVRLHDPLWMVRRVPLPPNRSVVAPSSVVSLCPSLTDRLNQGSLLPPLVSHIFCNAMGLPQPLSAIDRHPSKALDILAVYVLGIIGFTLAMVKGW